MDEVAACSFEVLIRHGVLGIGDGYRARLDELGGDGLIFLRAGALTGEGFQWFESERFHSSLTPKLQSKMGLPGDTVITTKGNSVGRTGFVSYRAPEFVYSPHLSYWRSLDASKLCPEFLRYWSRGSEFVSQLQAFAHGTDMAPYLSLADQRRLRISLPSIARQRAIAGVLGATDDKIAVNQRVVSGVDRLLGAMLDQLLADGNSVNESRLAEIALINVRAAKQTSSECLRYVDISSVSSGEITWPERILWTDAPSRARRGVSSGDTIWSTVRPGRRSCALVLDDDPELVVSTGFAVLTPTKVGPAFLYEITKRDEFVQYLESVAEGSAYPAVRAERFTEAVVPVPSKSRLSCFEEQAMVLRRRAHRASTESRILSQLRDTLLPKLISGEIRVRDAEKVVGEVL